MTKPLTPDQKFMAMFIDVIRMNPERLMHCPPTGKKYFSLPVPDSTKPTHYNEKYVFSKDDLDEMWKRYYRKK
jgi:hypothetical protein